MDLAERDAYQGRPTTEGMELVSVAAVAENGVIGNDGELPWPSIPADRRQYRERVAGSPVVLGRRTFESMREDLPGSTQVVLSRSEQSFEETSAHHASGAEHVRGLCVQRLGRLDRLVGAGGVVCRRFLKGPL